MSDIETAFRLQKDELAGATFTEETGVMRVCGLYSPVELKADPETKVLVLGEWLVDNEDPEDFTPLRDAEGNPVRTVEMMTVGEIDAALFDELWRLENCFGPLGEYDGRYEDEHTCDKCAGCGNTDPETDDTVIEWYGCPRCSLYFHSGCLKPYARGDGEIITLNENDVRDDANSTDWICQYCLHPENRVKHLPQQLIDLDTIDLTGC